MISDSIKIVRLHKLGAVALGVPYQAVISLMVSFCAVLFSRDVLDEIWVLIESVSEGLPTYSLTLQYRLSIQSLIQRDYRGNGGKLQYFFGNKSLHGLS